MFINTTNVSSSSLTQLTLVTVCEWSSTLHRPPSAYSINSWFDSHVRSYQKLQIIDITVPLIMMLDSLQRRGCVVTKPETLLVVSLGKALKQSPALRSRQLAVTRIGQDNRNQTSIPLISKSKFKNEKKGKNDELENQTSNHSISNSK